MPIIVINMNDTWTVLSDQPGLQVIGTIMLFFERVEYFQCTLVRNKYIYILRCDVPDEPTGPCITDV